VTQLFCWFTDAFDWSEADRNGRTVPCEGCDLDATCNARYYYCLSGL
jgi:hypothetical protein